MEVVKRWRAGEAQMRDNPGRGEFDPAVDVRRRCKKNSPSVLFCIGKRTKEGCDWGSEVGTVHSGRSGEFSSSVNDTRKIFGTNYYNNTEC